MKKLLKTAFFVYVMAWNFASMCSGDDFGFGSHWNAVVYELQQGKIMFNEIIQRIEASPKVNTEGCQKMLELQKQRVELLSQGIQAAENRDEKTARKIKQAYVLINPQITSLANDPKYQNDLTL